MHHPLFLFVGGNEHPAHKERREQLLKVMRRHDIDLIVTGHRHSYQRGIYGEDVGRFAVGEPQDVKTVFVVTASSTKRGVSKREGWARYGREQGGAFSLTRAGDYTPIFAVFDLDADTLRFRAVDATGSVYDSFTLVKDAQTGRKILTNGPQAAAPEIKPETAGPYIAWDDLR